MSDEYIRKELYEAGMKEIRAIFEASIAKQEAIADRLEKETAQIQSDMQKEFQEAKHQYEIDSAKRDEHYAFLQETFMQELKHIREYVDARFSSLNFNLVVISVIITIIALLK